MSTNDNTDRKLEIAPVTWHAIRPHLERDAIITVSPNKVLQDVVKEIAADNTTMVSSWIEDGSLTKPTAEEVENWNADPTCEFNCAIVQPFVVIQRRTKI